MAGNPTTFKQKPRIKNGNTAQTDLKLADYMPVQHEDSGVMTINHISVAQSLCQPVATTPNSTPSGGAYTATCSNYPDFSLTYLDKDGNSHYLIGMKVRVIFTTGITYGSISGGTYPTLNINGSGSIPLLAQGKTMASGACSAGQSLEFTLIPYGNGVAWDADSNVRESTSDYTIYTDGSKVNKKSQNYNLIITNTVIRGGGVIYYKTGNVITIQFDRLNTFDVTTSSSVEVGTIPEGFRPNSNYRDVAAGVVCGTTSGQRQKFSVTVSKNGVITIYNDYGNLNNTNFYATGSISYITDL